MSLLALQRDFSRHLTNSPVATTAWLGNTDVRGLAVYHNAYRVQLTDCLAETFAQTRAWLGGEAFVAAARIYIESSPPTGWTLSVYGDRFSDTLATLYPDDPDVAELAQLEWHLARTFEVEDVPALNGGDIATIDWDSAVIHFVPSLRMLPVGTNVGAIWSALRAGDPPPAATLLLSETNLLVWRQEFTPCFRTISQAEVRAILHLAANGDFAEFCATLVAELGELGGLELAGTLLGQWFGDGLIARVAETAARP